MVLDERVDRDGIDADDDKHDAEVPERQPDPDTLGLKPLHGSPSRNMKPTPRIVWINLTD